MLLNLIIILFIIFVLYLLAIMPKIFNKANFSDFRNRYYAHRGLHNNKESNPENSMTAFKLAVENDYGIELDVQLTKDKIPVVFHDDNLKRVCGLNKKVKDCTFDELQKLTLFDSKEKIPHFQEVLDLVHGKVPLIVELKSNDFDTTVCNIVDRHLSKYEGIYCIESFNPIMVLWYRSNRPNIIRGQLSTNFLGKGKKKNKTIGIKIVNFILQNLLLNFITKPDFIAFEHRYADMLSFKLCRDLYNTETIAYTIKSQEELLKAKNKFNLFIFDNFIPEGEASKY